MIAPLAERQRVAFRLNPLKELSLLSRQMSHNCTQVISRSSPLNIGAAWCTGLLLGDISLCISNRGTVQAHAIIISPL